MKSCLLLLLFAAFTAHATDRVNFVTCGIDRSGVKPVLVLELWNGGDVELPDGNPSNWLDLWTEQGGDSRHIGYCISVSGMGDNQLAWHSNVMTAAAYPRAEFDNACEASGNDLQGLSKASGAVARGQNFEFLAADPDSLQPTFLIHTHFLTDDELKLDIDQFGDEYCTSLVPAL